MIPHFSKKSVTNSRFYSANRYKTDTIKRLRTDLLQITSQLLNEEYQKLCIQNPGMNVRVMFQDEAGFGRINKPKACWCPVGERPSVPCHHIREYRYAYGAVEPKTGDGFFLVMPYCNTDCMNVYLRELSKEYPNDIMLMVCDGARWHNSAGLQLPENIVITHIPPYMPEMNPTEQIWKEIRKRGFKNEVFATLEKVVDRLCDTIRDLPSKTIQSITDREWIMNMF